MFQPFLAAALLLGQTASAPADCISREEAADMTVAFLPHLVEAVSRRCRPHLPPAAFLAGRSGEWIEQLRREAAPRRQSALRAFARFSGGGMPAPPEGASADLSFEFMAGMAMGAIIQAIQPQSCADIDLLAESLRPLPPENIGRIVAVSWSLAEAGQGQEEDGDGEQGETDGGEGQDDDAQSERSGPTICPA